MIPAFFMNYLVNFRFFIIPSIFMTPPFSIGQGLGGSEGLSPPPEKFSCSPLWKGDDEDGLVTTYQLSPHFEVLELLFMPQRNCVSISTEPI